MSHKLVLSAVLLIVAYSNFAICKDNHTVLCYHDSWSHYRTGHGAFKIADIDTSLCTHIVYAFLGISESNKVNVVDSYLMVDLHDLTTFSAHKGNAKALVSIGGANLSPQFSSMTQLGDDRKTFIDSVFEFLKTYRFDGIMLDWEYPGNTGGSSEDMNNFVKLLNELKEKLKGTDHIIGISGSPLNNLIDGGYDIKHFIDSVEFINVLTFDLKGPWNPPYRTAHASPLFQDKDKDSGADALKYWNSKGAPKEKLLLGAPLLGRTWRLKDAKDNTPGSDASGPGPAGSSTKTAGMYSYNELCELIKEDKDSWKVNHDNATVTVYAVKSTVWVSYDDPETLNSKAKWVKENGYGGMGLYALSYDDFHGRCGTKKYPLVRAVNEGLGREIS